MTFDRILVPLDGSRLAEASLPLATTLARQLHSTLVLVHALEQDPPQEVHGEPHLASEAAAQIYLDGYRDRYLAEGLQAEAHVLAVHEPDVARGIAQLADEFDADVVAMCAHGRRKLRDRLLGPIAQRALRGGGPPILLRTADTPSDLPVAIRHILVPIDFRHDLDRAMEDLTVLARGCGASVTLLHAVDARATGLPARMLPNTSLELSERSRDAARQRLTELATSLQSENIAVDVSVSTQDPDDAIIAHTRERETDLIILVTHGRSGVAAWYDRSVGRRMIEESAMTLLLLRV